jgi:hypothetical protein
MSKLNLAAEFKNSPLRPPNIQSRKSPKYPCKALGSQVHHDDADIPCSSMMPWPNTDACVRRPGLIDLSARVFERTKEFASMSKGPYPFKESDITRAIRAAAKAGKDVKIEIDLDRRCMSIIPIKPVEATSDTAAGDGSVDNPWDDILNANQKRAS